MFTPKVYTATVFVQCCKKLNKMQSCFSLFSSITEELFTEIKNENKSRAGWRQLFNDATSDNVTSDHAPDNTKIRQLFGPPYCNHTCVQLI